MKFRVIAMGLLLASCGAEAGEGARVRDDGLGAGGPCTQGSARPCSCTSGAAGTQVCRANLSWSACLCGGVGAGTGGAGGVGGAAGTGGAGGTGGVAGTAGAAGIAGMAGTAGIAGMAGMAGEAGTGGGGGATIGEPRIPAAPASCPQLQTGTIQVKGQNVQLWVGPKQADKKGAVFFYWHGTGGNSGEATGGLGSALQEIQSEGGLVASFTTSTAMGTNTGNNVWYTGDFEMADIILACAVQQLNIDTRRIYTGGCSAGGLQASAMVFARSSYLAGAMPNSGGQLFVTTLENPENVPAVITAHGAMGADVVIIDFATQSKNLCTTLAGLGGMAVDCDHGGGHCASPGPLKTAQWEFLKAHPFGVTPSPYENGLPASFPSYCKIY